MSEASVSIGRQRVETHVLKTLACRKNAFKDSKTAECGKRLRVGVRAKNIVASRGLRVGPLKLQTLGVTSFGGMFPRATRRAALGAEAVKDMHPKRRPIMAACPEDPVVLKTLRVVNHTTAIVIHYRDSDSLPP